MDLTLKKWFKPYMICMILLAVVVGTLCICMNVKGDDVAEAVEQEYFVTDTATETSVVNKVAAMADTGKVIAGETKLAPVYIPESAYVVTSTDYEKSLVSYDDDNATTLQSTEESSKKNKKASKEEKFDPEKEEVIVKFVSPKTDFTYMINITQLNDAWDNAEPFEWDNMDCHQRVAVIKNFLIDQMGVNENIAFGIMGNSANEGTFGMEQGTHKIFKNTDDAVKKLCNSSVHRGYGIIQWTSMFRREALAEFYKAAEKIDINFREVMFIAELVYMYEEVIDYKLFTSYKEQVELEDACGRVAREYEGYAGSNTDWRKRNGKYTINTSSGTSYKRYSYSKKFKELWGTK